MLGDAHGLDHVVVGFLRVLAEDLDPAGVARAHGVGVVAVDVDGGGQGAVDDHHDDGQAHRGRDVQDLPHQGQAADDVAVMTRAPAAAAPTQALMALCSLSTGTNSVLTRPSATNWEKVCTVAVCGVIG